MKNIILMFIPVRCFECNTILGDKYFELKKLKKENKTNLEIFEKLKLKKYCCRIHILNHLTITDI